MAPDPNTSLPVSLSSISVHHVRPEAVAIDSHGPEHAPFHVIRIGGLGHGVTLHIEGRTTAEKLDVIEAIGETIIAGARQARSETGIGVEAVAS